MRTTPLRQLMLFACLLVAPSLAVSDPVTGIQTSGSVLTTCNYGDCTPADLATGALAFGGSTSGSYNFDITAGDGDVYNVSGTFNNTFLSGTFLGFFPTVTLLSSTAIAADTITLDMFQDFTYGDNSTDWSGPYNEDLPFVLSASGTTAAGEVFYNTNLDTTPQGVGALGPVSGPGSFDLSAIKTLSPLNGSLLVSDFRMTFTFAQGSSNGTYISSPVPEPSLANVAGIAFACLLIFNLRRISSKRNSSQSTLG